MGNLRMNADQISYKGGNTPMTVEEALKNSSGEAAAIAQLQQDVSYLNSNKANKTDIATEFSDLTNYNAGDLVYYDGALYEFQVDHAASDWETSEVIQKDLSDIVTTLRSGLSSKVECVTISIDDVEFPAGRSGDFYAYLPSPYTSRTIVSAFAYSLSKAIKPYVSYVDNENKRVQYYTENSESSALTRSVTVTFLIV